MENKTSQNVLLSAYNKGYLCAIFVDAQDKYIVKEFGFYVNEFEKCEELRQTLHAHNIESIWIVYAKLAGEGQYTVEKFHELAEQSDHFSTVTPAKQEAVFNKQEEDGFSNKHLPEYIENKNYKTLIIAGFFSDACLKETALSALKLNPNIQIILAYDATDIVTYIDTDINDYIQNTFPEEDLSRVHYASNIEIKEWLRKAARKESTASPTDSGFTPSQSSHTHPYTA